MKNIPLENNWIRDNKKKQSAIFQTCAVNFFSPDICKIADAKRTINPYISVVIAGLKHIINKIKIPIIPILFFTRIAPLKTVSVITVA